MAKARAICTCATCGAEFIRETTKQNRTMADEWEAWAKENFDECTECYKKRMREEEKAQGLILNVSVMGEIDDKDGSVLLKLWFTGDTMSHKDEIKALGYKWTSDGGMGYEPYELIFSSSDKRYWAKKIRQSELEAEIEKAKAIGATFTDREMTGSDQFNLGAAKQKREAWEKKQKDLAQADIPEKPELPAFITGSWNGKLYGKEGKWRIYLDGKEVFLSNEEKAELDTYLDAKQKRAEALDEIENPAVYAHRRVFSDREQTYKRAEAKALESLTKPEKPACIKGYWNGKFYGDRKKHIFVDDKRVDLSKEEVAEIEQYLSDKETYKKEAKELGKVFRLPADSEDVEKFTVWNQMPQGNMQYPLVWKFKNVMVQEMDGLRKLAIYHNVKDNLPARVYYDTSIVSDDYAERKEIRVESYEYDKSLTDKERVAKTEELYSIITKGLDNGIFVYTDTCYGDREKKIILEKLAERGL